MIRRLFQRCVIIGLRLRKGGGQIFLLHHKGGVKILFGFLNGGSTFLLKLSAPNLRPPYEVINERSFSTHRFFFNKKPLYKKPVLNFFSQLRNRVLMFQVHKKLSSDFSEKLRIFARKLCKSWSDKKPRRN